MNVGADKSEPLTAIHTDLGAIFVSLELSRSSWLITSLSPGGGEKMSKHSVRGGDFAGLMERFAQLQEKARLRTGQSFRIIVIQEAGLDGFWIHRALRTKASKATSSTRPRLQRRAGTTIFLKQTNIERRIRTFGPAVRERPFPTSDAFFCANGSD